MRTGKEMADSWRRYWREHVVSESHQEPETPRRCSPLVVPVILAALYTLGWIAWKFFRG